MKTITCDKCKKSKPLRYDESYPKDFVLVKVFMKPTSNRTDNNWANVSIIYVFKKIKNIDEISSNTVKEKSNGNE